MQIGEKVFVKGEFSHVYFLADFNDDKTEAWIISNETGNPYGWTDVENLHRGDYFGEEMASHYASLLED